MAKYLKEEMPHKNRDRGDLGATIFELPAGTQSGFSHPPGTIETRHRRRFSAEEKLKFLGEAEACTKRGELSALLKEKGIYHSMLLAWRQQREEGLLQVMTPKKRSPRDKFKAPLLAMVQILAKIQDKQENIEQRIIQLEQMIAKLR